MGRLEQRNGERACYLEPEHLVGRADSCSLQLSQTYVSAQHALFRYRDGAWELIDRGSRNGTWADGVQLKPGQPWRLKQGSAIAFGHADDQWILSESNEPCVFVVDLEREKYLLGNDGVIGVPSSEAPACTVYRDRDGIWKMEFTDQPAIPLRNGVRFDCRGRAYRFCSPAPVNSTTENDLPGAGGSLALHFLVSHDEEFVELEAEAASGTVNLGSRGHNYFLLTLARARMSDQAAGVAESACGWVDKTQLAAGLRMAIAQLDLEVFRIRKHFAHHGITEAAAIIERRPRVKQLRLGVRTVRITRS